MGYDFLHVTLILYLIYLYIIFILTNKRKINIQLSTKYDSLDFNLYLSLFKIRFYFFPDEIMGWVKDINSTGSGGFTLADNRLVRGIKTKKAKKIDNGL